MDLDHAIYAEYSLHDKPMSPGPNVRVFNTKERHAGHSIGADLETGTITLRRGVYHITAFGCVTYADLKKDVDGKVTTSERPNGTYCLLYQADNQAKGAQIAMGSIGNANMVPSTIDTYVHVEDEEESFVLVQQAGQENDGIYLQVSLDGTASESHDHVFARISIRRIS